jgi:hypothetical protein
MLFDLTVSNVKKKPRIIQMVSPIDIWFSVLQFEAAFACKFGTTPRLVSRNFSILSWWVIGFQFSLPLQP